MNTLLASLPAAPLQPGGSAGSALLVAAAAVPASVPAIAATEALALPRFLDALRAVVADDAQPFTPSEDLQSALEIGPAHPEMVAPPSPEPMLTGATLAFALAATTAPTIEADSPEQSQAMAATLVGRATAVAPGGPSALPAISTPQRVATDAFRAAPMPRVEPRDAAAMSAASATQVKTAAPAASAERSVQLPAASTPAAVSPGLAVAADPVPASLVLKLPNGAAEQWRQPLAQALGERLQVELGRTGERALIRLDPPMMGSIEIVIRHEGGNLHVHLTATHAEVLRQLQSIGENLRQDLINRQFSEVSVHVSDGSRDADGRQRQRPGADDEDGPGRALAEAEAGQEPLAFMLTTDRE